MKVREKLSHVAGKCKKAAVTASAMAMAFPMSAYAAGDEFFNQEVNIDPSNVSATGMMGKLLGVISVVFIIVGIFRCGTAAFTILEAYSEDNSAAINKGVKQLAIGAVFIAAPIMMKFLFGS